MYVNMIKFYSSYYSEGTKWHMVNLNAIIDISERSLVTFKCVIDAEPFMLYSGSPDL